MLTPINHLKVHVLAADNVACRRLRSAYSCIDYLYTIISFCRLKANVTLWRISANEMSPDGSRTWLHRYTDTAATSITSLFSRCIWNANAIMIIKINEYVSTHGLINNNIFVNDNNIENNNAWPLFTIKITKISIQCAERELNNFKKVCLRTDYHPTPIITQNQSWIILSSVVSWNRFQMNNWIKQ